MTVLYNKAKAIDHLQATIEVLETDGWCRGEYKNHAGAHCLAGASVAAVDRDDPDAVRSILDFSRMMGFESSYELTKWNDEVASGREEVIDRINERIRILLSEASPGIEVR